MKIFFKSLLTLSLCLTAVYAFSTGPPVTVCKAKSTFSRSIKMIPNHYGTKANETTNAVVTVERSIALPHERLNITITSPGKKKFQGQFYNSISTRGSALHIFANHVFKKKF
jgi:hypothetical protein